MFVWRQTGQQRIQPRILALLLVSIITLTSAGAYLYLFKRDLKELNEMRQLHNRSLRVVSRHEQDASRYQVETLRKQITAMTFELYGKHARQHPGQMVSAIIGELDVVAASNRVKLVSVKPGVPGKVMIFEEIPFDVEVSGRYFDLYQWLLDAERQLRPMVVKRFHLLPPARGDIIRMQLRIVAYRPLDAV